MMTFAAAANAAAAAQNKKKTYRICKWSGDCDADDEYYWRGGGDDDDEDTGTSTADERRYYKWYLAQSRVQWRDDDVDDSRRPVASVAPAAVAANKKTIVAHVPFMNLTAAQRAKKSKLFNFGLCSDCDAGLCNESEFVCKPRPNGAAPLMTCNACSEYFWSLSYMRVEEQKERGGCN
jgi:hypothetical protein